jgi:hypothetical protein
MIHREIKPAFVMFSRNGRWGTCGGCPRDANGAAYPELCQFTERHDHWLDVDALADAHKRYLRESQDRAPQAEVAARTD